MVIFLDTADVGEIEKYFDLIDGVTTNPSLLAQISDHNSDFYTIVEDIAITVKNLPVSVEVSAVQYDQMLMQGDRIFSIAENITLKLPLTLDGIRVCNFFAKQGRMANMTLCFTISQAIFAAKARAAYVSPFIGRHDDINQDGIGLINEIQTSFIKYGMSTKVLAASVRHPWHFLALARMGVDAVTLPPFLLNKLLTHPLTVEGEKKFKEDWNKSGLQI